MKKWICSVAAVLLLAAVSAPVWADQAKPAVTPVAKTMKHKKVHTHKKGMAHKKEAAKKEATPSIKK
jgi:hypothetical protein